MSRSACANLTLYQIYYVYLREDMVQIVYAPLEVSAVGIREVGSLYSHSFSTDSINRHNTVPTTIYDCAVGVKFMPQRMCSSENIDLYGPDFELLTQP